MRKKGLHMNLRGGLGFSPAVIVEGNCDINDDFCRLVDEVELQILEARTWFVPEAASSESWSKCHGRYAPLGSGAFVRPRDEQRDGDTRECSRRLRG